VIAPADTGAKAVFRAVQAGGVWPPFSGVGRKPQTPAQPPYGARYRWTTTNRFGGQSWLPRRAIERAFAAVTLAASGASLFMQIATNVAIASDARAPPPRRPSMLSAIPRIPRKRGVD
jgi:hypothetical protein